MIRFNARLYSTLLILACVLLFGAMSCTKASDVTNANTNPTDPHNTTAGNASVTVSTDKTKLNQLFGIFRSTPQHFSIPAGTLKSVISTGFTKLNFYDSSFVDPVSGFAINTGNIDVTLVEMYNPGTVIANRATTMTSLVPIPLISGGQIYITASQNGVPVLPKKYGVGFYRSDTITAPRELYYGNTINEDSLVMWGVPGAVIGTTVTATVFDTTVINTGVSGSYLYAYKNHFIFDSVSNWGYVGCEHLPTYGGTYTNLDVQVPDSKFNSSNTEVFIVYPATNSVSVWNSYDPIRHTFGSLYTIPTGTHVTVVVLSNINGSYFYHELPVTVANTSTTVTILPLPHAVDYIKGRLSVL